MGETPMDRVRRICLAFPEATEQETWGSPTFRVRSKIFAMAADHDGGRTMSLKAAPGEQHPLLESGGPYFYPPYVGSKGWVGVRLDDPGLDWEELSELLADSYRLIAPKRLGARLPGPSATAGPSGS